MFLGPLFLIYLLENDFFKDHFLFYVIKELHLHITLMDIMRQRQEKRGKTRKMCVASE